MKGDEKGHEDITRRLDAIIRILLRQNAVQEMNALEQIMLLDSSGLKDREIAAILGRSRGYVSSELARIRKMKK